MSEQFYNPYQFIPVDTCKAKGKVAYQQQKNGLKTAENTFARHDYWHKTGVSGRITCTLTALSPLVVGAGQTQEDPKASAVVKPYLDKQGQPAIPGNSLRGMISSIAETISQSSLRVLLSEGHGEYSVRKPAQAKGALPHEMPMKHMGILFKRDTGYEIYPLADDDQLKAFSIGDYLNKRDDDDKERREWREKENNVLKKEDCFQYEHNQTFAAWRSHEQGIYYVRGKMKGMPSKRRETYIPWDGCFSRGFLPVDKGCVETFEVILRTLYSAYRGEDRLNHQLLPKGYNTSERQACWTDDTKPVVWSGDVVYYRLEKGSVVEVSYSSIWRRAVPGDVHQAFRRFAGEDSRPWNPQREYLTPAEALFGVVEDTPDHDLPGGARNLASRVRFADAHAIGEIALTDQPVFLKILNSPKPPSPALYFSATGGEYVEKTRLDMQQHAPNGRKHYLPHKNVLAKYAEYTPETPWVTQHPEDRPHMRLSCRPVPAGSQFKFTLNFENLSLGELGLLLTALQPKGKKGTFIHRLGLGKPIGLGHVQLSNVQCEVIDRPNRYQVAQLKAERYQVWDQDIDPSLVDPVALDNLVAMSDPEQLEDWPVCYPIDQIEDTDKNPAQSPDNEDKSYRWFTQNERVNSGGRHDFLHREQNGKPMKPLFSGYKRNKG